MANFQQALADFCQEVGLDAAELGSGDEVQFRMGDESLLGVVQSEDDVLVPAFLVQTTAQTYGQRAHIFRDMGHAVSHEKEWPLVAATLRDWLDELRP